MIDGLLPGIHGFELGLCVSTPICSVGMWAVLWALVRVCSGVLGMGPWWRGRFSFGGGAWRPVNNDIYKISYQSC